MKLNCVSSFSIDDVNSIAPTQVNHHHKMDTLFTRNKGHRTLDVLWMKQVAARLRGRAGNFWEEGCWGEKWQAGERESLLRYGCDTKRWRGLNGGRQLAVVSAKRNNPLEENKKGCCSEKHPLLSGTRRDLAEPLLSLQWRPHFLLSVVCVCVSVFEPSVSLTHTGWNGLFLPAPYQVSPGSSVVAAAIHRGWIALMKTVSSWSPPVALELMQPVNTGNFKESRWYWCDLLTCRFTRWVIHCQKTAMYFFFIFRSAGTFGQRKVSLLMSHLWSFPHCRVPLNTKVSKPSGG